MKRRKIRKRKNRKPIICIMAAALVLLCILGYSLLHQTNQKDLNNGFSYKAAIVDQLSLSEPNQTFTQTANNTLKQAGYSVDYYPGEEVTVEFYRNLPARNYGLIILRVHSVTHAPDMPYTGLFSSENYTNNKYVYEQLTDQVQMVRYGERGLTYFAISSKFIQQSMKGRFANSIVVMMGCNGLTYPDMAEALVEKGAKVYVSWTASVSSSHTDKGTMHLLQHLIYQKQPLKQAIESTMKEIGPDPTYKSELSYYPLEAEDYIIQDTIGNQVVYGECCRLTLVTLIVRCASFGRWRISHPAVNDSFNQKLMAVWAIGVPAARVLLIH